MSARLVLSTLVAAALCLAAAAPSSAALKPCGKVSLGFTSAKVRAGGLTCGEAREVFHAWRSVVRQQSDGGPPPSRVSFGGFHCRQRGTDLQITLRCRNGRQVMRARWGG